jgi:myo-inositol catabolism protein IolC
MPTVATRTADHRDSLERDLYDLTAPPTPVQAARISADKLLVYQALLDATAQLPAQIQLGMLIDEQYGASVAELASHSASASPTWTTPATTSAPGRGCCPLSLIRCCDKLAAAARSGLHVIKGERHERVQGD